MATASLTSLYFHFAAAAYEVSTAIGVGQLIKSKFDAAPGGGIPAPVPQSNESAFARTS
jgi:hypothetical protein